MGGPSQDNRGVQLPPPPPPMDDPTLAPPPGPPPQEIAVPVNPKDFAIARVPRLGNIQSQTAQEYAARLNPEQSYAVDTIREDGVVLRRSGHFHKTTGDGATGGYFSGPDGMKYHNTGTTEDGRVIARHSVDSYGNVQMHPPENGPRVFTSEVMETIRQLGLKPAEGQDLVYTRRGFTGTYKLQIERDGSFSVHYSGGYNSARQSCNAQTFHHGHWDEGRKGSLWTQPDQSARWDRWNARERGEETAVSVTHNQEVAKTSSGFHTATASITAGEALEAKPKLFSAPPVTTEAERKSIATITDKKETWSGTYIDVPGPKGAPAIVPPTYSFACQHNGVSGILNIRQNTLETEGVPAIVKATYQLAINENNESVNNQSYRSLLTDVKMLLSEAPGKETVVMLLPDGSVRDVTNNNIFRIQVKEGEPISWIQEKFVEQGTQPGKETAPVPSNLPDETSAPASKSTTITPEEAANRQSNNLTEITEATKKLLDLRLPDGTLEIPASFLAENDKIQFSTTTGDKIATAAAVRITVGDESAYSFARSMSVKDESNPAGTLKGAMLFVRKSELEADKSDTGQIVANVYKIGAGKDGPIKLEELFDLGADTKARIRPDGSVEVHDTEAKKYSIIRPIYNKEGTIIWDAVEAEPDSTGRLQRISESPTKAPTEQATEPVSAETSPTKTERTYTAEQRQQAHDLALSIYNSIDGDKGLWSFSEKLKEARTLDLSELMQEEYKKLAPNTRHLPLAAHYYSENPNHRDVESHIKAISLLCEPESKKELVEAAYDLQYRVSGVTDNEGLVSFALTHRKDWPEIERIFDTYWSSYYSGDTSNPISAGKAMENELGIVTTAYMAIQHFVNDNPEYKFSPMSVASQMRGMIKGFRIDDNEAAFVDLVEMTAEKGQLREVEAELKRLHSFTIKELIDSEGFSREQKIRLQAALKGFADITVPEQVEYTPSGDGPYTSI